MRRLLILALLTAIAANPAAAQRSPPIYLAVDAGPSFPLGAFADDGARRGWAGSLSAAVRVTRRLGVYGAWERTSFPVSESAPSGGGQDWTDTGVGVGLRVWLPVSDSARVQPWVQAGPGWHDLDPLIAGPAFQRLDLDGVLALEAGGGLDIRLTGRRLFLRPAVRYRSYRFAVDMPDGTARTRVRRSQRPWASPSSLAGLQPHKRHTRSQQHHAARFRHHGPRTLHLRYGHPHRQGCEQPQRRWQVRHRLGRPLGERRCAGAHERRRQWGEPRRFPLRHTELGHHGQLLERPARRGHRDRWRTGWRVHCERGERGGDAARRRPAAPDFPLDFLMTGEHRGHRGHRHESELPHRSGTDAQCRVFLQATPPRVTDQRM